MSNNYVVDCVQVDFFKKVAAFLREYVEKNPEDFKGNERPIWENQYACEIELKLQLFDFDKKKMKDAVNRLVKAAKDKFGDENVEIWRFITSGNPYKMKIGRVAIGVSNPPQINFYLRRAERMRTEEEMKELHQPDKGCKNR